MCIKSILPFPDLPDLLITMLVFLIVVWSCWVIDIIPVLYGNLLFLGLPLPFPPTSLSLLSTIETIHIIIFNPCPICQCSLGGWSCYARSGCGLRGSLSQSCAVQWSGFWEVGLWLWLLRQLGSFGRLESQGSCPSRSAS